MPEPAVYFIGAGPGAPDLLTIRGQRIIARADVIVIADSLVHPGVCDGARPGAEIYGSSTLPLAQILDIMVAAARAGKCIARVHSGDPSLYGAIHEQMVALDAAGISYEIIPGVSSAFAAAAALHTELTIPDVAQSVIFTRAGGRTGLPGKERLAVFAAHGVTMVIFLSIAHIDQVAAELREGGYPAETPIAVVYRVTWEDQAIWYATLDTVVELVRREGIARQALLMVGPVF
ncbi:MAG: precorrin-4 C(11)-methyltransferase, partial [Chloroflexi bacterium]|nr:precorrin-4 C(11)-methyltransferase [Chloroflexota bacterium]